MGKATRERLAPRREVTGCDATPERLAKDPGMIVHGERENGKHTYVRQFSKPQLDRWHAAGLLSYRQYLAGAYYRDQHERCKFGTVRTCDYGDSRGGGCHPGAFGYGLPQSERTVDARSRMRELRSQWNQDMQGFMERFLIRGGLPRYGGNQHHRAVSKVRNALDAMANYLRL